jgi:hypothetical protein
MIVIRADTHKQSHTVAALSEATGRVIADLTVRAKRRSFEGVLAWGRAAWTASGCGRSRIAGTCPERLSGSCRCAANAPAGSSEVDRPRPRRGSRARQV